MRGANGAVAAHLSAGLDSAIVTATAGRLLGAGRVTAFTAAPSEAFATDPDDPWISDESGLAARLAATQDNIDHIIIRGDGTSPIAGMARDFFFQQQPTQSPLNAVWGRAISKEASSRKLGILLSGGGGNFTATYSGVEAIPEMLARGSLLSFLRGLRSLHRGGRTRSSSIAAAAFPLLPDAAWRTASQIWRRPRGLTEYAAIAKHSVASLEADAAKAGWRPDFPPRRDPVKTRIDGLSRTDGANFYKGVLAEWGLSIREPLLDLRLVRLCLAIPPDEYLIPDRPRDLARRSFADRLPPALLAEQRRGLQAADWAQGASVAVGEVREELTFARRTAGLADVVDLNQLEADAEALASVDLSSEDDELRFQVRLLGGIATTYFARRTAGTN